MFDQIRTWPPMNKVPIVLFDLLRHRSDRLSGSLVTTYTKEVVDTTRGPSFLGVFGFPIQFLATKS